MASFCQAFRLCACLLLARRVEHELLCPWVHLDFVFDGRAMRMVVQRSTCRLKVQTHWWREGQICFVSSFFSICLSSPLLVLFPSTLYGIFLQNMHRFRFLRLICASIATIPEVGEWHHYKVAHLLAAGYMSCNLVFTSFLYTGTSTSAY